MPAPAFDTYAAVKRLREAGVDERQAEAFVATVGDAMGEHVTKADLAELRTAMQADLRTAIAEQESRVYRFLMVQAAGIIGLTVAILRFLG